MTCLQKKECLLKFIVFVADVHFAGIGWCDSLSRHTKNYSSYIVISSDFFRYILRNNDLRGHYCLLLNHWFFGLFESAILRPLFFGYHAISMEWTGRRAPTTLTILYRDGGMDDFIYRY